MKYTTKIDNFRSSTYSRIKDMDAKHEMQLNLFEANTHYLRLYIGICNAMGSAIKAGDKESERRLRGILDALQNINVLGAI